MMTNVCCLQEVRWIGQGSWMLAMEGRKYRLWSSEKGHGFCVEGFMVNVERCK